ncbi:hypothetical protein FOCC_FOCC007512 [Frankliniella occidentalis]|nr:hypothetical protein FOCC_FOCC007512 [Frankliniella occidentalis]
MQLKRRRFVDFLSHDRATLDLSNTADPDWTDNQIHYLITQLSTSNYSQHQKNKIGQFKDCVDVDNVTPLGVNGTMWRALDRHRRGPSALHAQADRYGYTSTNEQRAVAVCSRTGDKGYKN